MTIQIDTLIKIATVIGVPSLFLLTNHLIKGISLVRSNSIERLLMSDQKKLTTDLLAPFFFAAIFSFIAFIFFTLFFGVEGIKDSLLSVLIIFLLIMLFGILGIIKSNDNKLFSIVDDNTRLYIHKITPDGDVILSNERIMHNYSNVILQKKEYLYGKDITAEYISTEELKAKKSVVSNTAQ